MLFRLVEDTNTSRKSTQIRGEKAPMDFLFLLSEGKSGGEKARQVLPFQRGRGSLINVRI